MKNELHTPRFWISILLTLAATGLAAFNVISGEAWLVFAGLILAGWGIAKAKSPG